MQTAANTLRLLANRISIDDALRHNLEWVGHFLEEVDLASFGRSDISADFAVSATEARPFFYEALANIDNLLKASGIENEPELHGFLTDTFSVLISGGGNAVNAAKLSLAALLLERFATAILMRLNTMPPPPSRASVALEMAI